MVQDLSTQTWFAYRTLVYKETWKRTLEALKALMRSGGLLIRKYMSYL